jgi:hypothetical protein
MARSLPEGVDAGGVGPDDLAMTDDADPRRDDVREIDPREAERMRRRDHDSNAEARDLMRPGMGKVFKQIQDAQARAAKAPPARRRRG